MNALDSLGQTALHRVAQQGNMQACRLLMSYAIDPSIVSHQGYTAAQLATDNIQKLLQGEAYVLFVITSCDRFQQECTDTVFHSEVAMGKEWCVFCCHPICLLLTRLLECPLCSINSFGRLIKRMDYNKMNAGQYLGEAV